nr:SGNH/GDSL hydrolase family protein [Actinomyces oris]
MLNHSHMSPAPSSASSSATPRDARSWRRHTHLGALACAAALVWTSAVSPSSSATPLEPSPPAGAYVALGDSYASGVGAPPYASGTDVQGGNGCKRGAGAYAHQVADQIGKTLDFDACAGARTPDFYQPGKEAAQLNHLNSSTALVTFSIGGNDAGFSTLFSKCVTAAPFTNCSGNKEVSEQVDGAIDALAGKTTRAGITSYDTLVADIASRAPGATVVAVGYPRMFTPRGAGQVLPVPGRCEGVTKVDQRWINAKTNEINAAARAAAQRHGHRFTDPSASFAGHELCGKQSSWFDGLVNDGRFHPNAAGHKAIAGSVMNVLKEQPAAAQAQLAAAQAQVDNTRPAGSFTLARNGDQLALDASASTDSDGTITNIDWYIQRADNTEEILTGAQATATVPADEQVSVTAVITDNQGKEDFTTQTAPAS